MKNTLLKEEKIEEKEKEVEMSKKVTRKITRTDTMVNKFRNFESKEKSYNYLDVLITENEVEKGLSDSEGEELKVVESPKRKLKIGKGIATLRKKFNQISSLKNKLMDIELMDNLANSNTVQNIDSLASEKVYLEFEKTTNKIPVNIYGQDFGVKFSQRQWKKFLDQKLEEIADKKRKIELKKLRKKGMMKGVNKKSMVMYSERKMFMKFNESENNGWVTRGYRKGNGESIHSGLSSDTQKDEKIVFNRVNSKFF